jgi:hypothetical protein
MNRKKLGICFAASLIALSGATYLATPAGAATRMSQCSSTQLAAADADASKWCRDSGLGGGYASSCDASGSGYAYTTTCQYQM